MVQTELCVSQVVEEQLLINAKDFAGEMAQLKVKLMEYEMVRSSSGAMASCTDPGTRTPW